MQKLYVLMAVSIGEILGEPTVIDSSIIKLSYNLDRLRKEAENNIGDYFEAGAYEYGIIKRIQVDSIYPFHRVSYEGYLYKWDDNLEKFVEQDISHPNEEQRFLLNSLCIFLD